MAEPTFDVDLERLLTPIPGASPAGVSLRYEGTYSKIQEARREDDATLPQGVWETKLKVADWRAAITLASDALEKRSKDLQIAIWLAEAWLNRHGFPGIAPGLELSAKLLARFWDTCFPDLDDDGDARVNLVEWMDDTFGRKIRIIPFTGDTASGATYTLEDWEAALQIDRPGARSRVPILEDGSPASREAILARISLTGYRFWADLLRVLRAALAAAELLEQTLAARLPKPPVLMRMKDALRSIERVAEDVIAMTKKDAPPEEVPALDPAAPSLHAGDPGAPDEAPPRSIAGPIGSRADAYRKLSEAADFLLRTEPHSPVPYLVKRAISWGNMSLAELLYEFVGSPDDLVAIQRLLGMRGKE